MSEVTIEAFNEIIKEELMWAYDMGVQATEMGQSTATLMVPYDEKMLRPGGTLSGPTMIC